MKKVFLGIAIIFIIVWVFAASKNEKGLVRPTFVPTPVATPNAPKTYFFDSSTDLKQELEKVNPQIFDSDFE